MATVNGRAVFTVKIEYVDWSGGIGMRGQESRDYLKARIREEILKGISNSGALAQHIKSISVDTKPPDPTDPEA